MAVSRHSHADSACFLCQGHLLHFDEKTALACRSGQSHKGFSGRESAPGAREKRSPARATRVTCNGILLPWSWGLDEGGAKQCTREVPIRPLSWQEGQSRHR